MFKSHILVLGAHGMLGRTVYNYLKTKFPNTTWGTIRGKQKTFFYLDANTISKNINDITRKIHHVDFIINCIGSLPNCADKELQEINAEFPIILAKVAKKYHSKVIHVSTDAVFPAIAGRVREKNKPFPDTAYGKSKLLGEADTENFLAIRTSLIGLDPEKHKGLLEWVLQYKDTSIPGFTNQIWSGCTTLQFAMLCEKIMAREAFDELNKKAKVYHFAPIYPISKYKLLQDFLLLTKKKILIKKIESEKKTRILTTDFAKELWFYEFTHIIFDALQELIRFETKQKTI